jgi:hypothetical protein
MTKKTPFTIVAILAILLWIPTISNAQTGFEWGRQIGTEAEDFGKSLTLDSLGNVYITGWTNDTKSADAKGGYDVFICKMDSNGKTLWFKHYGTPKNEKAEWIVCENNSIVITGETDGDFENSCAGESDAFVLKTDLDGNVKWVKQIGSKSSDLFSYTTIDDSGNIYCIGNTNGDITNEPLGKQDVLLVKLDKNGQLIWKKQIGTPEDDAGGGIFVDKKYNIYVCGTAHGPQYKEGQDKTDAFYAKYDKDGKQLLYKEFGTDKYDNASSILVDKEENLYIGGSTGGKLGLESLGYGDGFLVKINPKYQIVWKKQFGTKLWDGVLSIKFDQINNSVLVSGCQNYNLCQGFCREYDKTGKLLWKNEFTTQDNIRGGTCGKDAVMDNNGNIYHTGGTGADIFGNNQGLKDIYIVKLKRISDQ